MPKSNLLEEDGFIALKWSDFDSEQLTRKTESAMCLVATRRLDNLVCLTTREQIEKKWHKTFMQKSCES